jgi:hypothetical protein
MGALGHDRLYRLATLALFSAALYLVCDTVVDYGITWDEHYHEAYGRHVLDYYRSGFRDQAALTYHNLWLYGGAFDGLTALVKTVSPLGNYETAHLMNALVGLIGVLAAYRMGCLFDGPRGGFWAATLLLITPSWYGHMFNNPKDIPFAAGIAWSLYFMIRAAPHFPRVPLNITLWLGLSLGLTLGVRIAGVFALIYLGAALTLWALLRLREAGLAAAWRESWRVSLTFLLPSLAVAWLVMLAGWPWAQQNPLLHPLQALTTFSNNPWDLDTLFEGRLVNSLHLPADYLSVYFLIRTPELILVLLAAALVLAGAALRRHGRLPAWSVFSPYFVLAFAAAFPFVFFIAFRPVSYDGIRHFLFVLPPVAVIAGVALARLFAALSTRPLWPRAAFSAVILAYLGWHTSFMRELHPDQYVYYNQLVGGVDGAENRYELDYWGNSYHEAVDRLVAYINAEEQLGPPPVYRIMVCSSGISAAYYFPKHFVLARHEREADFYISNTRLGCDAEYEGETIISVERDDAVLSVVKDRRWLRAMAPERLEARLKPVGFQRQHPGVPLDVLDVMDY